MNLALLTATLAFICWGLLPLYLRLMAHIPAFMILSHRIFWSFIFMLIIAFGSGQIKKIKAELAALKGQRIRIFCMAATSILICANWLTFIWAINNGRVLETSLGYYILPLLNILFGLAFLGERLSLGQGLAVALATLGVLIITIKFGSLPWVSIILALSMTFYTFCKKVAGLSAVSGLLVETSLSGPFALFFIFYLHQTIEMPPLFLADYLILIGTGLVTVVPLILFAKSLNNLPLSYIGIIQYISPTMTFFLGIFYFKEAFSLIQLVAFILIWLAVILFTLTGRKR